MKKIKASMVLCILVIISLLSTQTIYGLNNVIDGNIKNDKMVDNILLIGKDGVNDKLPARSDTMIILTIDKLNESLKLTSLARDTLVKIPGRGYEKLNHAYAYGQEELLVRTINENFNLNIEDYAVVNFKSFIEIIDILGGVDVSVNEKEIDYLNKVIQTCYDLNEDKTKAIEYVTSAGDNNLNGYQALAYARIRKMDTIYKRDERQRIILSNIAQKLSTTTISNYPQIVKSVLRHVKVNIAFNKIMKLALMAHELGSYEIKQLEFPLEQYREEGRIGENGAYVVKWDERRNIEALHNFIYGNEE
ncbi:MAG: LCP family protein [Peptostreptococcaceae bacterium]